MKMWPWIVAVGLFTASAAVWADYIGAGELLDKAGELQSEDVDKAVTLAGVRSEIGELEKTKSSPEEWLALNDRALALMQSGEEEAQELQWPEIAAVMPPPESWEELANLAPPKEDADGMMRVERLSLAWLADRLVGNPEKLVAGYEAIRDLAAKAGSAGSSFDYALDSMSGATVMAVGDEGGGKEILLARLRAAREAAKELLTNPSYRSEPTFRLPVALDALGPESTREFLIEALTTYPGQLQFGSSERLRGMGIEIVQERLGDLAAPPWELATSLSAGPLFDLLSDRFPDASRTDRSYLQAKAYVVGRLLVAGQVVQAADAADVGMLENANYGFWRDVANAGGANAACDLLGEMLAQKPDCQLWSDYLEMALRADRTDDVRAAVSDALKKADLNPEVREQLLQAQLRINLAANDLDAGVAAIREQLNGPDAGGAAVKLATIGELVDRAEWFEEGITAARTALAELLKRPDYLYEAMSVAENSSKLLLAADRGEEAESLWVEVLATTMAQEMDLERSRYSRNGSQTVLANLVGIYTAGDRPADVMTLVNEAKGWGAIDLSEIADLSCSLGEGRSKPLGVCVAEAMAATGRDEEAAAMVEAMLPRMLGEDSAYALLVKLRGQEAIPVLDRLMKLDAFEERPLIWKAQVLLDAGELAEAETTARAGIAIDPSDGEQGPGDRMRVYAVLAEILDKKGEAKDAEFLRGVVKSIRLSERGDRFWSAGLLSAAIAIYEESLTYFQDAYCVQSRLALRLSEQGDWEAAEEHYRRAYELMPDSFGRVESHCFGCERAFDGERRQSIAERVFTKLVAEQPENPQVHYLLGYLRNEEGRPAEAVPEFRRAVELDPDYLNAWLKLARTPDYLLDAGESERIALALIRLDPVGRRRSLNLDGVKNLTAVWEALEAAEKAIPPLTDELMPLPASAKVVARRAEESEDYAQERERALGNRWRSQGAGEVFANQDFVRAGGVWLSISSYMR